MQITQSGHVTPTYGHPHGGQRTAVRVGYVSAVHGNDCIRGLMTSVDWGSNVCRSLTAADRLQMAKEKLIGLLTYRALSLTA